MRRNLHHQNWRHIRSIARSRKGMSLVEVMVVIAIILTLMGILTFGIFTIFGQSKVETTKLSMGRIAQSVNIASLKGKLTSGSEGLKKIFPDGVPKDSWDNEFVFEVPGPNGKPFELISLGADGQAGGTELNADIKYSEVSK